MRQRTSQGIYTLVAMSFVFCLIVREAASQDKCGIVDYTKSLQEKKVLNEKEADFENWLTKKINLKRAGRSNEATRLYQVPVVVHVIHNGEAIGVGANISDEQIVSQIKVLNKDFKRLNADSTSTPDEFKSVAGKFNIEFVLAKQSPDGITTTGINRVKGTKTQWATTDDATLKALSYWPAEDYLNIWVTNLSSTLLGYAQFPVSSLAGLESAVDNRLVDGVVIDYTVFGSIDDGSFSLTSAYNKGRTTTHEIGHFFGLRHIWGDVTSCTTTTDYVDDTPAQNASTSGCPSNPQTACSNHKMFQNYMDYTNDACMNIYTVGQVDRMVNVIENSPRRVSLLTSHGLDSPDPISNDLSLVEIVSPTNTECDHTLTASIKIKNVGLNAVSSAAIQLKVNSVIIETKDFAFSPSLNSGDEIQIYFSSQIFNSGTNSFEFQIQKTNGTTDAKTSDNLLSVPAFIPYSIALPFSEGFNSLPSTWFITNSDALTTWSIATAPNSITSNTSLSINLFNYSTGVGESDVITTPIFDLTQSASPYFAFDVAYATGASRIDQLKVYVITECGGIVEANKIYDKSGSTLATAGSSSTSFIPTGIYDWRREIISLNNIKSSSRVQLAFVVVNGQGNNLYIDNVAVTSEVKENVSIQKVTNPSPVRCDDTVAPSIIIKNNGQSVINSLRINYSLNGATALSSITANDFSLSIGATTTIVLPEITLSAGLNALYFELTEPNGWNDIDPSDNLTTIKSIVNTSSDVIPLRENFNSAFSDAWTIVNPKGEGVWETTTTNYDQSLVFKAYSNTTVGDEAWLVSPVLDLSKESAASVFFDQSYRLRNSGNTEKLNERGSSVDLLKVLASSDCGNIYDKVLFSNLGDDLSDIALASEWTPTSKNDWIKTFVNLDSLVGGDKVRLAFVFSNGNGNNIYLDNIEFFQSDYPNPPSVEDPFYVYGTASNNPGYFYVTFNLEDRQSVNYQLISTTGQPLASEQLSDVLNQTYKVATDKLSSGVYIFRLQIAGQFYAKKVFVSN